MDLGQVQSRTGHGHLQRVAVRLSCLRLYWLVDTVPHRHEQLLDATR